MPPPKCRARASCRSRRDQISRRKLRLPTLSITRTTLAVAVAVSSEWPGLHAGPLSVRQDRAKKVSVRPTNHPAPTLLKSGTVGQRAAHAVNDTRQAKLFLVSGMVQGVGYRYFAQRVAHQLGIHGYAKNLSDGRVEVYAIGQQEALDSYRTSLARGPRSAEVSNVEAEDHPIDERYADGFSIEYDW